ncbi:MAG TPA: hypothetical protein VIP56_13845, partial [Nitrososphaeraceae archaeon]
SVVDFTDLYEMRNDITGLLERRITAIDQKLGELSKKYGMERREPIKIKQQRFIEKGEEKGGRGGGVESLAEVEALVEEGKSEGKNIDELQKEIIEALHRLDQVEIGDKEPSKPQTIGTSGTFNDKSCLRQFR